MIGTLVGSGIAAGLGALFSARENAKQRRALNAAEADNRANYLSSVGMTERNKDWALRRVQAQNDKALRGINGGAVSTGMTNENRLAAMGQAGDVYADAVNGATANQVNQQLGLKQNYEANQHGIDAQRQQLRAQRGQMWSNLGSNLAGSILDYGVANEWFKKGGTSAGSVGGTSGGSVGGTSGGLGVYNLTPYEKLTLGIGKSFRNYSAGGN